MPDLSRKRERDRLKIQRDPHYMRLGPGAFLGFRRGPDTWTARYRDRKGKQHYTALEGIASNDYDGAKRGAEEWCAQLGNTAVRTVKRATVKDALETYLAYLKAQGRANAAREALGRFKRTVYKDPIANEPLESMTLDDFEAWRERSLISKGLKARSVNRQARAVMAALTYAHTKKGHVGNPAAWGLEALPDDVEDAGETAIFLSPGQRAALIAAADPHAAAFLQALEHTGARPGEVARLVARDFDGVSVRFAHRKGRGSKVRTRHTVLGPDGVTFFAAQVQDKLPAASLFTEDGVQTWRRHIWARQVRAAAAKVNEKAKGVARIPPGVGAYSFRHARISELLQVHGVDPLTTGQQTGTSLAMIEKAYHRFIPAALHEKLAALKAAK